MTVQRIPRSPSGLALSVAVQTGHAKPSSMLLGRIVNGTTDNARTTER